MRRAIRRSPTALAAPPTLAPVLLGVALACAACRGAERDAAARRAEIESALEHYESLVRHMQSDSIAALYTPDGELLGTNLRTIRTPDSIRAFLGSFRDVRVDSAAMRSDAISLLGDEAVQWGTYTQAATVPGRGMVHLQGRFVADWRRDASGRWRLRRMLAQPTPP